MHQPINNYLDQPPKSRLVTRIRASIERRGILQTVMICLTSTVCRTLGHRLGTSVLESIWRREARRFDRRHSVRTAGFVSLKTLHVIGENAEAGSSYIVLRPLRLVCEMFSLLRIEHRRFTFVDFGSGMGRILFLAAENPFRKIIGVEFSPELHAVAEQNIRSYRNPHQRCFEIESVCRSAEDFDLPEGDLVLFFANPFGPAVMRPVIGRIERAMSNEDRDLWILYAKPTCGFLFDSSPSFQKVHESTSVYYYWYSIYRGQGR